MLQKSNNHFDIEEFNILHCEKVANLIYRCYTETNLVWNVLPSKREETKTAITRRLHKCMNSNLSHVAVQNNRVVACIISIELKNLEALLQEEKALNDLPVIFQYLNKNSSGFFDQMIESLQNKNSQKSSVMLFAAVDSEFANSLLFLNLIQWNIDQQLLSGFNKYLGITGNCSRFLNLAQDKVNVLSSCQISDKENSEIHNYKMSLISYDLKPILPRASL